MRTAALFIGALLATSGCGTEPSDTINSESSEAATMPVGPMTFDSVYDLREAVEAYGFGCTDWSISSETLNAIERAQCTSSVNFGIHGDATEVQLSIETIAGLMTSIGSEVHFATGPNCPSSAGRMKPSAPASRKSSAVTCNHSSPSNTGTRTPKSWSGTRTGRRIGSK
jgi:hypothetical protein